MRIINLIENTEGQSGCIAAHGLSFYVETQRHKLLLDLGPSADSITNADLLGIDLSKIDTVVLSHGQYDHAGGIMSFAERNPNATIYMQETAVLDYYADEGPGAVNRLADNVPDTVQRLTEKDLGAMERLADNAPGSVNGITNEVPGAMGRPADNAPDTVQRFTEKGPGAMENLADNIPASFNGITNECAGTMERLADNTHDTVNRPADNAPANNGRSCQVPADESLAPDSERYRYIGIDKRIADLPQVQFIRGNLTIDEELSLFTIPHRSHALPFTNKSLLVRKDGELIRDDFIHEQFLVINDGGKHVLMSGCAHNGILSILDEYRALFGADPDLAVSGFHLMKKTDYKDWQLKEIREIARELKTFRTQFITCHCTGLPAYEILKEMMGEQLSYVHSGEEINLRD